VGAAGALLKLVSITDGTQSWLGVDASGVNASLVEAPVTVTLTDGAVKANEATNASKLNWTSLHVTHDSLELPFLDVSNAIDLLLAGTLALKVDIDGPGTGTFTATGSGTLGVGQVSDNSTSPAFTDAQATAVSLDTSLAAGGVGAAGASVKLASIVAGTDSWFGVDASGITGS